MKRDTLVSLINGIMTRRRALWNQFFQCSVSLGERITVSGARICSIAGTEFTELEVRRRFSQILRIFTWRLEYLKHPD